MDNREHNNSSNRNNKREQDILDDIKSKAEDIKVPESISPEAMAEKLKERPKKRHPAIKWAGAVAAALALVLAAGAVYRTGLLRDTGSITADTATLNNLNKKIADSKEIVTAKSYDEVYEYLEKSVNASSDRDYMVMEEFSAEDSADSTAKSESSVESAEGYADVQALTGDRSSPNHSETNIRQGGVDEGDVAKTDGRYLYVLKNQRNEISIVDTKGSDMKEVARVSPEDFNNINEIYVQDDRLIIVGSSDTMSVWPLARTDDSEGEADSDETYVDETLTMIRTYDISDKKSPELLGEMSQSGYYKSSRIVDGYIYIFSDYSVYNNINKDDASTYIPKVNNEVISESDICLPAVEAANNYTVITAVSVESPEEVISSKAMLSQYGQYYVSNENIYYYEEIWDENKTITNVRKLSYDKGNIESAAQGKFDGNLNDSFSIDEYEGNLRVVTTVDNTNALYIFDENLEKIGSIEGLAEDERVYSARLMGDTGYFVTFRNVDPLFSVDLSDPTNPKILGELKIPGFSQYLHPYSEGLLLGIGMDADEETGATEGLKLSMFDISDNTNVIEAHQFISERDYYTNLFSSYKGLMIDTDKNIFGFSTEGMDGEHYCLFTYDEDKGFVELMRTEVNNSGYMETRGIYIDDTLYVICGNIIESYSLETYEKVDSIIL